MKKLLLLLVALVSLCGTERCYGLKIIRDFSNIGIAPTNSIGGGDFITIMNAACDVWELAIRDDHTLTIRFKWAPVGGGQHELDSQGGSPNRELIGTVSFNNDNDPGHFAWYLDPSPFTCLEATGYSQQKVNLGCGPINATRCYTWSEPGVHMDLLTAALHEIGHALGMSFGNQTFITESCDGDIDITSEQFNWMSVPLGSNNAGYLSHIDYVSDRTLMSGSYAPGERVMPSVLDIVTLAQLSGFKDINVNLLPLLAMSKPYASGGVTKIDLSWMPVIPAPQGMHYSVQTCADLGSGIWSSVTCPLSSTNGISKMTVPVGSGNAFFKLIVKDNPSGLNLQMMVPSAPLNKSVRSLD